MPFEMNMFRSVVGFRWDDFFRNAHIRETIGQPPSSLELKKSRMKWLRQVEGMGEER